MHRPSRSESLSSSTAWRAKAGERNSTLPDPRGRPVSLSVNTLAWSTSPTLAKCSRNIWVVVSKLIPPTKTIESRLGFGPRSPGGTSRRTMMRLPIKNESWSTLMARCASSLDAITARPAGPTEVVKTRVDLTSPAWLNSSLSRLSEKSGGRLPTNSLQSGSAASCGSCSLAGRGARSPLSMTRTVRSRPSNAVPWSSWTARSANSNVSNSTFPAPFGRPVSRSVKMVA
mmetsp:Transcript_9871/g.30715  ORF Transcript_9871/g.30715 Transcript_9871/m.30715 type:complete len:229 (+) Transcript_9871:652-1338(+)